MKLLILNGPNLNLLCIREPELYGTADYAALVRLIGETCDSCGADYEVYQSNHEGALVDKIQAAYADHVDGIVLNAAAYSHTSIAILDALKAVRIPTVEVHLTDIAAREPYRRHSYVSEAAEKVITGHGIDGYRKAILWLAEFLRGAR